jgi:hypothetical protein
MTDNSKTNIYSCKKTNKWIKITKELMDNIPFTTDIIKCSKCKSYAFLNFIHEELGEYYGPNIHKNCEGKYVYLCVKKREHIIDIDDENL